MNETYFAQLVAKLDVDPKLFNSKIAKAASQVRGLRTLTEKPMTLKVQGDTQKNVRVVATSFDDLNSKIDAATRIIVRFNQNLLSSKEILNEQAERVAGLTARVERLERQLNNVNHAQARVARTTQLAAGSFQDFDKMMTVALQKLIRYRMIFFVGRGVIRGYKEAIDSTIKATYEMAQIQKVMTDSMFKASKLWEIAEESSLKYGKSITESITGMKIWAQQGKTIVEIQALHEATMLGAAVANLTATESVEALTAATKAYKVDLNDLVGVVDVWMNVQARHAVTARDLAGALKVVGNAAQLVGVDMYDLAANVTAVVAVTRKSGIAVANSLKTMFSRFARPVGQKAIARLGIETRDTMGVMRDFDDVMADLYVRWDSLNDVQRVNIAYSLGGVRRYADFTALLENYGEKLQASANAHSSEGAAIRALGIEMDTLKKKMDQIKAVSGKIGLGIGSVFISSFDGIAAAVLKADKSINGLDRSIGKALGTFGVFIAVLTGFFIIRSLVLMFKQFAITAAENALALEAEAFAAGLTREQITQLGVAMGMINAETAASGITFQQHQAIMHGVANSYRDVGSASLTVGMGMKAMVSSLSGKLTIVAIAISAIVAGTALWRSNMKEAQEAMRDQDQELLRNFNLLEKQVEIYDVYTRKLDALEESVSELEASESVLTNKSAALRDMMIRASQGFYALEQQIYQTEGATVKFLEGADAMTESARLSAYAFEDAKDMISQARDELNGFTEDAKSRLAELRAVVLGMIPEDIETIKPLLDNLDQLREAREAALPDVEEMRKLLTLSASSVQTEQFAKPSYALEPDAQRLLDLMTTEMHDFNAVVDATNTQIKGISDELSSPESKKQFEGLFGDDKKLNFMVDKLSAVERILERMATGEYSEEKGLTKLIGLLDSSAESTIQTLGRLDAVLIELNKKSRGFTHAESIRNAGFEGISEVWLESMMDEIDRFNGKARTLEVNIDFAAIGDDTTDAFLTAMDITPEKRNEWVLENAQSIYKAYRSLRSAAVQHARQQHNTTVPTYKEQVESLQNKLPALQLAIQIAGTDERALRMAVDEYMQVQRELEAAQTEVDAGRGEERVRTMEQQIALTLATMDAEFGLKEALDKATDALKEHQEQQRLYNHVRDEGQHLAELVAKGHENELQARKKLGANLREQMNLRRQIALAERDAAMAGAFSTEEQYQNAEREYQQKLDMINLEEDHIRRMGEVTRIVEENTTEREKEKGILEQIVNIYELAGVPLNHQRETLEEIIDLEHQEAIARAEGIPAAIELADAERQRKLDAIELNETYGELISQAKELTKAKYKQHAIERKIHTSLGKVLGLSSAQTESNMLRSELRFRGAMLQMHREDAELFREEMRHLGATEDQIANIQDLDDLILKDERELARIRRELSLAPLLMDLEKVKKALKEQMELLEDFAEGIAESLMSVPSAIAEMYTTRQDYLDQIAEREEEIAEIRANADPSTDNYHQQLELADRMQEKVNRAKRDVQEMTGAMATVLNVVKTFGEQMAEAYNSILEEQFTERLKQWLVNNAQFTYKGQILSASEQGAQKFYDAITRAVEEKMVQTRDFYADLLMPENQEILDTMAASGKTDADQIREAAQEHGMNTLAAFGYMRYRNVQDPSELTPEELAALEEAKKQSDELKRLRADWALFSNYLGVIAGTLIGGGGPGSAMGSQFGGMVGQIGTNFVSGALANFLPGIGSILGGLFGSFFNDQDEGLDLQVEALEDNTNAVNNNTRAVEEMTKRLINAPSTFTIPALAGLGGGGGTSLSGQARLSGTNRKYL